MIYSNQKVVHDVNLTENEFYYSNFKAYIPVSILIRVLFLIS